MAHVLKDRVKTTSTTTGTGTYTLGSAATGFQAFSVIGDGNTTFYTATDGTDWEVGVGTYTAAGTTLARTTILASSNAGAAVNWAAGTRTIFCGQPAAYALPLLDPNADRILFWDDSAGVYAHLTASTGLDLTGTSLSLASTQTTSQPTSDTAASTSESFGTGLSAYKSVTVSWLVEMTRTSGGSGTHSITIQARVSGGTYRTIATLTTPTMSVNDNILFGGSCRIDGFSQSTEKVAVTSWGFSASSTTLDSSSATNTAATTSGVIPSLMTWDEVWDEVAITLPVGIVIEWSTTDQRGRMFATGSY